METNRPNSQPIVRFHGRFRQKIDEKGRVSLPAIFRRAIPAEDENGTLILREGPDGYLQAVSVQEWESRIERLTESQPSKGAEGRWRRRKLVGSAVPASIDEKGRFTIPRDLLDAAGIGRDCLILGVDRAIEIWNPDRYFELEAQHEMDLSDAEDILF
jgi:MraZ protein